MNIGRTQALLAVARGDQPADLLFKNAKIVNTFSYEIIEESVAIYDGRIAGIGDYATRETIDLHGAYLSPSLIDGHIHIESSLLAPDEFARAVVKWGTGAVVCDPHEIANVCGAAGIQYMLDATEGLPIDVYVMLSSCVPATDMETAGAILRAEDLRPFLSHPRVLGLAEVMNFPGVIFGQESVLRKLEMAGERPIDGHAPGVSGKWLNAYAAAGIRTDHESTTREEAEEKLRLGMYVLIREGSTAKNLRELIGLVTRENAHRFAFVSDDRHADDILSEGHLNSTLRLAVEHGIDSVLAIAMGSTHTAQIYGLHHTGAIAPGRDADMVVFEDLHEFIPKQVWKRGKLVAEGDTVLVSIPRHDSASVLDTVKMHSISECDLAVKSSAGSAHVIEVIPDQIVTEHITAHLPAENGKWTADKKQDIAKLVVVERYGKSGSIGKSFVRGFGLSHGALASTVAHDSHNIICVGMSDSDMTVAINALIQCSGGLVVVADGEMKALLPLPIGGLMSDEPAPEVVRAINDLHRAANALGCTLSAPFMALSFLALPVIPKLKLTDRGLFDVTQFKHIELAVS